MHTRKYTRPHAQLADYDEMVMMTKKQENNEKLQEWWVTFKVGQRQPQQQRHKNKRKIRERELDAHKRD